MAERFKKLVKNVDEVNVGEEVRVNVKSKVLPGGDVIGTVRSKDTVNGKHYLDVSGIGGVKVPASRTDPVMKVYRAAPPRARATRAKKAGRRHKTRRH